MKKTIIYTSTGLMSIAMSQAAIVSFSDATSIGGASTYVNPGTPVTNTATTVKAAASQYFSLQAFDIDALLTSEGLTLADLATRTFTISFATTAGADLGAAAGAAVTDEYTIGISNFHDGGSFPLPDSGTNGTTNKGNWEIIESESIGNGLVGTGIQDDSTSQTLSRSGLSLNGATAGQVVGFAFGYTGATSLPQELGQASLSVDPVPEPSSTALLALGGMGLIIRRRR